LTFDFTRLRLGLQIGIFGIIVQGSDFPEIALQNCKSDMTTPLREWASLICLFLVWVLAKLAKVEFQKLF
jgi:hypothetical protein